MGTWGVALFSDDIASGLREDFRDLIGDGLSTADSVDKLILEYSPEGDPDLEPVFWLALSAVQWKLGRLEERTKQRALKIIENGQDLKRWDDIKLKKKREIILQKLKTQLLTQPPAPKKVPKRFISENDWKIGEVVGFQLASKRWVLLRVIGHHVDKGGRNAVCELLDWIGEAVPEPQTMKKLKVKKGMGPYDLSQFFFPEPENKNQLERIRRTGFKISPQQKPGSYTIFVWKYIDRLFKDIYGLE
jgi:hypothetical protein